MEKEKVNLSELKATSAADLLKVAETFRNRKRIYYA